MNANFLIAVSLSASLVASASCWSGAAESDGSDISPNARLSAPTAPSTAPSRPKPDAVSSPTKKIKPHSAAKKTKTPKTAKKTNAERPADSSGVITLNNDDLPKHAYVYSDSFYNHPPPPAPQPPMRTGNPITQVPGGAVPQAPTGQPTTPTTPAPQTTPPPSSQPPTTPQTTPQAH